MVILVGVEPLQVDAEHTEHLKRLVDVGELQGDAFLLEGQSVVRPGRTLSAATARRSHQPAGSSASAACS